MAKMIIHGIGRLILKDFVDPSKVISYSDLQNFSVESTFSSDDITGGNKLFPIASFKKEQALNCSATNATFEAGIIPYLDGGALSTGAVALSDFIEVAIPEDGVVTLPEVPTAVTINGFEAAEGDPAAGSYKLAQGEKTVTFAAADAGKTVVIVYDYNTSAEAMQYSVTQKSLNKPFKAIYNFDIYDEDTQITHKGSIVVYKAQCTSGLKLDLAHQTAFAPEFSFSARDAKRQDGKLWDFTIDGVSVGA